MCCQSLIICYIPSTPRLGFHWFRIRLRSSPHLVRHQSVHTPHSLTKDCLIAGSSCSMSAQPYSSIRSMSFAHPHHLTKEVNATLPSTSRPSSPLIFYWVPPGGVPLRCVTSLKAICRPIFYYWIRSRVMNLKELFRHWTWKSDIK